jgi:hypothetical protein
MTTTFSSAPYFDDYDPDKKFHRILFRPGFAVQTRELNQLQTILQEQVSRFGDHVFENGSLVIPGAVRVNGDITHIRLQEGTLVIENDNTVYEGATVANGSGVTATITTISRAENTDPVTLYLTYTTGGEFAQNEQLTLTRNDGVGTTETVTTEDDAAYTGKSTLISIERGVYFLNDEFVIVNTQQIVASKYLGIEEITGELSVGLFVSNTIVTPEEDESLLDNAQGTFNETAPGAHRYKINANLILRDDVTNLENYTEIARIVRGEVAREVRESEYDVLGDTLAKRTYEESGDYVIKNFNIGVEEHPTDSTKLRVELEEGKAYVRGYRIETTNVTRLDIDKARTTEESGDTLIPLQQGDYLHVKTLFGHPDLFSTVKLYSDSTLSFTSDVPDEPSTQIGTATVRAITYDPVETGSEGETVVRVHLYNFSFSGSNRVADIGTVYSDATSPVFAGEISAASIDAGNTVLQEQSDDIAIYQLPFSEVDTITDSSFNFYKKYSSVVSGTDVTISTPISSEQFRDETTDFLVFVTNVVNGSTSASVIGDIATPDSVTLSTDNKTATLDLTSLGVNDTDEVSVFAIMFKSPGTIKTKSPVIGSTITTSATPGSLIDLGKADVYEVTSITDGTNDYTRYYELDTGQRNNFYDISSLKLRPGFSAPTVALTVTFNYFNHGTGDFFVADSYDSITYDDIPTYTSEAGVDFPLANSIDFRPIIDSSGDFSNSPVGYVPDSEAILDFEYYLPRKDKVVLTSDGSFGIIPGSPDLNPNEPSDVTNGITLYNIDVNAYTFGRTDVSIESVKHPRFRMKDIGELENRITNLEYFTSLNLVEQDAISREFIDKFKTGILVDSFTGHQVGDARKETYRVAVDPENGELRAEASTKAIPLFDDETGSNYQVTGSVVTLPYDEVRLLGQDKATRIERIQPFIKFTWDGQLVLEPSSDSWVSTQRVPDTTLDGGTEFTEAFQNNRNSLGTVWGGWRTFWRGNRLIRTRTGTRITRTESTEIERLGDRVVNRSAIPFIRSRVIEFTATGMKPQTDVTPYFDDVDVTEFVTPDGGSIGDQLKTDGLGTVSGSFDIPNEDDTRFRTGNRVFELKDVIDDFSTNATATYSAQGILEDISEFFLSTQIVDIDVDRVTTSQTIRVRRPDPPDNDGGGFGGGGFGGGGGGGPDPLAQSFVMPLREGGFVTSIDIYFGPDAAENTFPVTIQIRAMENGFPSPEIAPFGSVTLPASQIGSGSSDSSVATRFAFDSPVYLEQDVEYCFVILTNSDTLTVWQSVMGQEDILSGERVTRQPFLGSLFKSQNNRTWSPAQLEDLKFVINRAQFDTNVTGLVSFENEVSSNDTSTEADPYLGLLPLDPFTFSNGSKYIRVDHPSHSMVEGDTVRFTATNSGDLGGIPEAEIFDIDLTVSVGPSSEPIDVDTYYVEVSTTNADRDATLGGAAVFATQHVGFSVIHPVVEQIILPNASANWEFSGTSKFGRVADSGFRDLVIGEDNRLTFPRTSVESGDSTVTVRANLSSDVDNLSPYIDTKRFSLLATENRINNREDTNSTPETDEAAARYITSPVELINPANELRILFDANRPPSASIDVYYKVGPAGSNTPFVDQNWEKVTPDENVPSNENYDSFSEYEFTEEFAEDFIVYAIKIVMRSTNEARVPRIRDLRVISVKG